MNPVIVDAYNITSSLGADAVTNFNMLVNGISGVQQHADQSVDNHPAWVSLVPGNTISTGSENFSRYEQMLIASIREAKSHSGIALEAEDTLFVFSTTKGNISLLEDGAPGNENISELGLYESAKKVTAYFGNGNEPVVISNACISGVVALLYAKRMLNAGICQSAVVTGADTISRFVYSGFQSFQALSNGPCHPFASNRDGINLGEASATVILTVATSGNIPAGKVYLREGGITNDSNHISGPSRTGLELSNAINTSLKLSGLTPEDIGFISAHGTATPYNDEMEAKAFHESGLANVPVNSLKGYFGHTLGAAGILESVISMISLERDITVPSAGYQDPGVVPSLNVITEPGQKKIKHCLKTASGFGGCNAAIIFSKN